MTIFSAILSANLLGFDNILVRRATAVLLLGEYPHLKFSYTPDYLFYFLGIAIAPRLPSADRTSATNK